MHRLCSRVPWRLGARPDPFVFAGLKVYLAAVPAFENADSGQVFKSLPWARILWRTSRCRNSYRRSEPRGVGELAVGGAGLSVEGYATVGGNLVEPAAAQGKDDHHDEPIGWLLLRAVGIDYACKFREA